MSLEIVLSWWRIGDRSLWRWRVVLRWFLVNFKLESKDIVLLLLLIFICLFWKLDVVYLKIYVIVLDKWKIEKKKCIVLFNFVFFWYWFVRMWDVFFGGVGCEVKLWLKLKIFFWFFVVELCWLIFGFMYLFYLIFSWLCDIWRVYKLRKLVGLGSLCLMVEILIYWS